MKATQGMWDPGKWTGERPEVELRCQLEQIPGLRIESAHRGVLKSGRRRAWVRVETCQSIGIELPVTAQAPGAVRRELPGNLRFAWSTRGLRLIADIDTDPAGLARSFEEIDRGLRLATRRATRRATPRADRAPEASAVQATLEAMGFGEGAVVEHENGWEARPRVGDSAVPVKIDPTSSGLHVHRAVLDSSHDIDSNSPSDEAERVTAETAERAIGDQVLRLNAAVRWARLDRRDGGIVAETNLHVGLVTPRALAIACRAVAAAAHHSRPLLAVLAQQREVTRQYFHMFLNNNPPGGD